MLLAMATGVPPLTGTLKMVPMPLRLPPAASSLVKTTSVPFAAMPPTYFTPVASVTTVLAPPLLELPPEPPLGPPLDPPLDPLEAPASPALAPPAAGVAPPLDDEQAAANSAGMHAAAMAKDAIFICVLRDGRGSSKRATGLSFDTTDWLRRVLQRRSSGGREHPTLTVGRCSPSRRVDSANPLGDPLCHPCRRRHDGQLRV